jgi:hypothetical protein
VHGILANDGGSGGLACGAPRSDGNLDILRMPGGGFAWELTEAQAEAVIADVKRRQRKAHGQSHWKLAYAEGTLKAFLKTNNIRA